MLLADLRKAIEDMEEIRSLEQDSQDSQNQNRIDHLYAIEIENNINLYVALKILEIL